MDAEIEITEIAEIQAAVPTLSEEECYDILFSLRSLARIIAEIVVGRRSAE